MLLLQLPNPSALAPLPRWGLLPAHRSTSGLAAARPPPSATRNPTRSVQPQHPAGASPPCSPPATAAAPRRFCSAVAADRWGGGDLVPFLLENCKPRVSDLFSTTEEGTAWERLENFTVGGKLRGRGAKGAADVLIWLPEALGLRRKRRI